MNPSDDLKFPNRRPWLLVLLIVVLVFFGYRYARTRWPGAAPEAAPQAAVAVPVASVVPAAGSNVAAVLPSPAPVAAASNPVPVAVDVPAVLSAVEISNRLASVAVALKKDQFQAARVVLMDLLKAGLPDDVRQDVEIRVAAIHTNMVFTPMKMPEKIDCVIKPGDSIDLIAKRFGTTVRLIQRSNFISDPDHVRIGDLLRVFTGRFALEISKEKNELLLNMNGAFFRRYKVGTGKYGRTPVGTFIIVRKEVEPAWWTKDGVVPFGNTNNILGTRWMELEATGETMPVKGYGIHGTWDDPSIGKAESAGCIRMHNADVEELFDLLPYGAPVVITE
jgi:lipoprotein-anchoring transpeptidase ErfK/SrfK